MLHPAIFNTSALCHNLGVRDVVMSPGSRNAPLTISFARNEMIKKWIIPDERSAAFIALGIAQASKRPVVLCCTSGTALLNYAPAIAEAYYREIPLVVLSADRPLELIDQRDGQTIRQFGALKNFVKNSYQLPLVTDQTSAEYLNKIAEGISLSKELPKGPVHLNIPFKEPFYPAENQMLKFHDFHIQVPEKMEKKVDDLPNLDLRNKKILILIGQKDHDQELNMKLSNISHLVPILASPLSNAHPAIYNADLFLNDQKELVPDLLITTGYSVLSKRIKNFFRKHKPTAHWHFDLAGVKVDTYQSEPITIKRTLSDFIEQTDFESHINEDFKSTWDQQSRTAAIYLKQGLKETGYSELKSFEIVFSMLPSDCTLHLGNSMPVRFAELLGVRHDITVYSNRGTSGIDGVTSTAMGHALADEGLNVLVTGDLSFLYDRNAFFHNHRYNNLKIVVMNNQGGGIFRLIDGPREQPELEEYFETRHDRSARSTCEENGIRYQAVSDQSELRSALDDFFGDTKESALIEIFTDPEINSKDYMMLKECLR